MQRIYLDNNATTPLDPRVFKAMMADLGPLPANPSSVHHFGQKARALLTSAREKTAQFFRVKPDEVVFTSGGTESLNHLLRGLPPGHIITTSIEHSAIYETLKTLPHDTTYLPVGLWGAPTPDQIEAALKPTTQAIVLTLSNGETGVKIDLPAIADLSHKKKIPLLLDAVSYIGKEAFVFHPAITAIAFSAHKFHGPKGVGALLYKHSLKLKSFITGGAQEHRHRAGTENLAGILGLTEALQILTENQTEITQTLQDLQAHFEKKLLQALPDIAINGDGPRICNTSNIAFSGCDGETLLIQLDLAGVAASHGSACSSGALEPSRVLTNMGLDRKTARSSLRFSFSRMNTREEIDTAADHIIRLVRKYR